MLMASTDGIASLQDSGDLVPGNASMRHFTLTRDEENIHHDSWYSSSSGCDINLARAYRSRGLGMMQRTPSLESVLELAEEDLNLTQRSTSLPKQVKVLTGEDRVDQLCDDLATALAAAKDELAMLTGDPLIGRIRSVMDTVREVPPTVDRDVLPLLSASESESSSYLTWYSSEDDEPDLEMGRLVAKEVDRVNLVRKHQIVDLDDTIVDESEVSDRSGDFKPLMQLTTLPERAGSGCEIDLSMGRPEAKVDYLWQNGQDRSKFWKFKVWQNGKEKSKSRKFKVPQNGNEKSSRRGQFKVQRITI